MQVCAVSSANGSVYDVARSARKRDRGGSEVFVHTFQSICLFYLTSSTVTLREPGTLRA
jgi:hypothetical protein